MLAFITQLLLLGGCTGQLDDSASQSTPYSRYATWSDDTPGTAFGSALGADATGAWVGVPDDSFGRIDRVEAGGRNVVFTAEEPSGVGHSLAWDSELGLVLGAPLVSTDEGRLLTADGSEVHTGSTGQNMGSAMVATDGGWIVGGNRLIVGPGFQLEPPGRPRTLAVYEDRVVAGIAQLRDGIWLEEGVLHTSDPSSLAGTSLCVADVDEDGQDELVVGAPGSNRIYVLDTLPESGSLEETAQQYEGTGHFGWSLACRRGEIWIGAPLYGERQAGAVYHVAAGDPEGELDEPYFTGAAWGSQLGYALALGPEEIWMGSPGSAEAAGRVDCAY